MALRTSYAHTTTIEDLTRTMEAVVAAKVHRGEQLLLSAKVVPNIENSLIEKKFKDMTDFLSVNAVDAAEVVYRTKVANQMEAPRSPLIPSTRRTWPRPMRPSRWRSSRPLWGSYHPRTKRTWPITMRPLRWRPPWMRTWPSWSWTMWPRPMRPSRGRLPLGD